MANTARCPVCDLRQKVYASGEFYAHFEYARRRWCPGGPKPTKQDMARRRSRRSVRAVSGGLPS